MSGSNNSQNFNISGSTGVSFGNVSQTVTREPEEPLIAEPKATAKGIKILFLAANPSGTIPLRLDQEEKAIDSALLSARLRDRFELAQGWAVSAADLQESLLRHEPDILHLSTHGSATGRLALESSRMRDLTPHSAGVREPVDSEAGWVHALARLFAAAKGRLRCVVLNACHSEALASALAEEIDCVIGMSDSISDDSAICFSRAFYTSLGYGQSVKAAFESGCAQVGLAQPGEEHIPQLLVPRCNPTTLRFGESPG